VNGAGKTTTFDILTGSLYPTAGSAAVQGVNVIDSPTIGYCPQFDALSADLTGMETLRLIGHLNGLKDVDWRAAKILDSVRMREEADKLVEHYSGGQKRRLAIGIALMSCSRLIMLDEPTAGVDPGTRRHIWDLLMALRRNNIAILLTTHSMEECERLCTRIGFMNRGQLTSIGASQHLKSKFGNTFLLSITVLNPSVATGTHLNQAVCTAFSTAPSPDPPHMSTFSWQLQRLPTDTWSEMYSKVDEFIDELGGEQGRVVEVKDYSLVQSSLEQVFIHLSKMEPGSAIA